MAQSLEEEEDTLLSGEDVPDVEAQQKDAMEGMIGKKVTFFVERDKYTGIVLDKVRINIIGSGTNTDYYIIADDGKKIHRVNPLNLDKLID
jgi:hypothetical protein